MRNLSGQVAIVTGSAQGIGRSCAETLAAADATIVVADLNESLASEVAASIADDHDVETIAATIDISDPEQCEDLIDRVSGGGDPATILVNCAALFREDPALEMDASTWADVVNVGLNGAFFLSQAFARATVSAGAEAKIVNISSVSSTHSMAGKAAYSAAKAGLDSLTRSLALEWGRYGIRVNAVAPSHVATEAITDLAARGLLATDRIAGRIPLGRLAEPDEIADAVLFLCSDDARFITGQILAVDGGYTINGDWQSETP